MNSTVAQHAKAGLNWTAKLTANMISLALCLRLSLAQCLWTPPASVSSEQSESCSLEATYHHISCATVAEATTCSAEVPGKGQETLSFNGRHVKEFMEMFLNLHTPSF